MLYRQPTHILGPTKEAVPIPSLTAQTLHDLNFV